MVLTKNNTISSIGFLFLLPLLDSNQGYLITKPLNVDIITLNKNGGIFFERKLFECYRSTILKIEMRTLTTILKKTETLSFKIMLLSVCSMFTCTLGFGQTIEGRVLHSETKQPLDNVNVYIKNTEFGTATNNKGEFELHYPSIKSTDSLTFSIIGYKTRKVTFTQLKEKSTTVLMQELTNELGEVIILGKKELRENLKYYKLSSLQKGLFGFGAIVRDDTIFIVGGSESFSEDTMRKAIYDATLKNPYETSWNQVLNEIEPNGTNTGYNNKLLTYHIELDEWQAREMDFEDRAYHVVNKVENKLYTLGGKKTSNNGKKEYLHNKIEILDLDSLNIIVDDTNPHQAIDFASFTYKDNILVMGGSIKKTISGNKVFTDKCHFFNTSTGYWYELENMTKAKQTDGAIINEKVYLIGGSDGRPISEIESLDLSNGKWKKEGDLLYAMENPSIASHNEMIYIYNFGKLHTYNTSTNTIYMYDIDLSIKEPEIVYHKNKLYVIGGYREERFAKTPSSDVFFIDLIDLKKTKIADSKKLDQL